MAVEVQTLPGPVRTMSHTARLAMLVVAGDDQQVHCCLTSLR